MNLQSEIDYWEHKLHYARSYDEERVIKDRFRRLHDELYYWRSPLYLLPTDTCNRAVLTASVPEKPMEPKTNENAAIAVLEAKLAEHKKAVINMATYVTSSETSQKAIKQIEAALKKLG